MFICFFDLIPIGPGKKLNKVVLQTRKKKYFVERIDEEGDSSYEEREGWEIVKEVDACDACASSFNKPMLEHFGKSPS